MPPRSPLPKRHGLDAAWVRTPDRDRANPAPWHTMAEWLETKLGEHVDVTALLRDERFIYGEGYRGETSRGERRSMIGQPVRSTDPYRANAFVWFHRDLRDEPTVPGDIHTVFRNDRIIIVDKPPFLATIPRGRHVLQSVIVRMRETLHMPEIAPVHRLDRVTSGLLVLTTERRWRAPYQLAFQEQEVEKTYHALAPAPEHAGLRLDPGEEITVRNHLRKHRGIAQVQVIAGEPPNAESRIVLERRIDTPGGERALYRLTPVTGKTHQLRRHMAGLGLPIAGDPLYPVEEHIEVDDFSTPLQLLASSLRFVDPVDHATVDVRSVRSLPIAPEQGRVHQPPGVHG